MQTPDEIGPTNASQEQHRRMDATEQMKNLTLARMLNQVLGISSADALNTKARMTLAEPDFLPSLAFTSYTYSVAFPSCGHFSTWLLNMQTPVEIGPSNASQVQQRR